MFPSPRLAEESAVWVVVVARHLIWGHRAIGLDAMLEAVELPAWISDLDAGLTNMDADTFTLKSDEMNQGMAEH